MRYLTRIAIVCAVFAALAVPVAIGEGSARAVGSAWPGGPVSISVELDLPYPSGSSSGPLVLQVSGVTPDAGVELTSADIVSNPSGWNGSVQVDIDPVAQTITVGAGQVPNPAPAPGPPVPPLSQLTAGYEWSTNYFQTLKVTVDGVEFTSFTEVSDSLWDPSSCDTGVTMQPATIDTSTADTTVLSWSVSSTTGASCRIVPGGTAVFSFTGPEPTTTTTSPSTTTAPSTTVSPTTVSPTTVSPTTTLPIAAASAATAVGATPRYTG